MTRFPHRCARLSLSLAVLLASVAISVASAGTPDLFDEIYARTRPVEAKLQTLRGRFTETTTSSLLVRPLVAKGTLLAAKGTLPETTPPRLLLEYSSPERKTVLMDGKQLLVVWPDRGESERIDITETMKRVQQYFGNADPKQVRSAFNVHAFEDREVPGAYQLDMVPKRKQISQGLQRLQLWVGRESLQMVQMRMTFPGGDTDTIRIEDPEINGPIDPHAFDVAVPPTKAKGR